MLFCPFPVPKPSGTLANTVQNSILVNTCACRNTSNQRATNGIKTQTGELKGKGKHPALQQKRVLGEGWGASPGALGEQKGNPGARSQRWLPRHAAAPLPVAEGCGRRSLQQLPRREAAFRSSERCAAPAQPPSPAALTLTAKRLMLRGGRGDQVQPGPR